MISKERMKELEKDWQEIRNQRIEEGEDPDIVDLEMSDAFKGDIHACDWKKEGFSSEEEYKKSFGL